jgi:phosphoribosylanthranilate isomerase
MSNISKEIEDICKLYNIKFDPTLSEDFIRKFKNKVNWHNISIHQKLSEDFIREFKDEIDWYYISMYQKLSESLIREFKDEVNWYYISRHQKLSENFIKKFKDRVHWNRISEYQKLSENFIRESKDKVSWYCIPVYQKLSEDFIKEFKDRVDWHYISKYQELSENFIREFKDEVNWYNISAYQNLSKNFRKEFNLKILDWIIISPHQKRSWLLTSIKEKLKYIKENTNYEIIDDKYIIAYKSVRDDYYSVYNFQYKYDIGKTYRSHCDCNLTDENSFGLSAWTKERAYKYYSKGKILKVQIPISKVGAIVHNNNKIRCFELKVLEETE